MSGDPAPALPPAPPAPPAPQPTLSMNASLRIFFACLAMCFFAGIIIYLIVAGKEHNSLHESALAWSFLGLLGVLAAFGFGTIIELAPYLFGKKQ